MNVQNILSRIAPLLFFSLFIFTMSSLSEPPVPDFGFSMGDKINHFGAFAIMAVLAVRAASAFGPSRRLATLLCISILYCVVYGASDEFHQSFVPQRSSDITDLAADIFGAISAAWFIYVTRSWRFTRRLAGLTRVEQLS